MLLNWAVICGEAFNVSLFPPSPTSRFPLSLAPHCGFVLVFPWHFIFFPDFFHSPFACIDVFLPQALLTGPDGKWC